MREPKTTEPTRCGCCDSAQSAFLCEQCQEPACGGCFRWERAADGSLVYLCRECWADRAAQLLGEAAPVEGRDAHAA